MTCSLADLILRVLPLEAAYTVHESGANFPIEVGTSAFLNALAMTLRLEAPKTMVLMELALINSESALAMSRS